MPLGGSAELAATSRTKHLDSLETLSDLIAETKAAAGPRGEELSFVCRYWDDVDPLEAARDGDRHRDAFAAHAAAGVTALIVGASEPTERTHRSFIDGFGSTYLN
jgi:hypothetical protein